MSAVLKSESFDDFSRVTASVYALASASLLQIIEQDAELQSLQAELQKETQEMQAAAAKGSGAAQQAAGEENANATRENAISFIAQGGISGFMALVGTPLATKAYGSVSNLSETDAQLANVHSWEDQFGPVKMGPETFAESQASAQAETLTTDQIHNVLQRADVKAELKLSEQAILKISRGNSAEFGDDIDALKEEITTQKKDLPKKKEAIEGDIQHFRNKMDTISQSLAAAVQGGIQTRAAVAQAKQAEIQNLQTQMQFASDSSKQAVDTIASYFNKLDDAKQNSIRTLGEIAANNRV